MRSTVSVIYDLDIHKAIPGALDNLGDISNLFHKKHVAIKPNDTWAAPDDLTPCTQADSVEAVIKYVKRYNPGKITVTGGAGAEETHNVFKYLGIDKVIKREGVEYFDHNKEPFKGVTLQHGPQREVMINPYVLEYDTLVSLAQLKVHGSASVTLTMKNIAMSYPAADYYGHPRESYEHPHNFFKDLHGFITGMCHKFPIDLGIIAGHPAMIHKGPIGGKTFESGLVIAGKDFVATDYIGAMILGIDGVRHITEAEMLNLGTASLENIDVVGVPLEKAVEIFRERSRA